MVFLFQDVLNVPHSSLDPIQSVIQSTCQSLFQSTRRSVFQSTRQSLFQSTRRSVLIDVSVTIVVKVSKDVASIDTNLFVMRNGRIVELDLP